MFDNGTGEFTVYNMNMFRDSAYLPDSTFEIVQSLVGIETGRMKDSLSPIVPIGNDTMKHWLDTLGYFPKVTGDEQLGLVKKLYFSQLPFQPRSQRIVKNLLKKKTTLIINSVIHLVGAGLRDL